MSLTNLKAITVVVAAIAALIAVRWVYFKILCIAKDKNLVDNPDARKLQKTPIPVMGGIAVFFGVAFGIMAGYTAGGMLGVDYDIILSWWIAVPLTIFVGVGIINAVNMIDGVNGLSSTLCLLSSGLYGIVFLKSGREPFG